jgi:hypothetical protein
MMKLLGFGALALTLGLGACAMHDAHREHMQGGMMGQQHREGCPQSGAHQPGDDAAAHEHPADTGQADCPPTDNDEHQHNQPQD